MCVSAVVVATAAFLITKNFLPDAAGLTAMSIGLYIGGTPNLLAIGSAMLGTGHEAIVFGKHGGFVCGRLVFPLSPDGGKARLLLCFGRQKTQKQKASDKNTTENKVSVETATRKTRTFQATGARGRTQTGKFLPTTSACFPSPTNTTFSVVERNKKAFGGLSELLRLPSPASA